MTQKEREKRIAIKFAVYCMDSNGGILPELYQEFTESEAYQSIPEADEWIPVGERLPEVGLGGVLVLIESIPPEHYEQFQKVANYDESGWICQYAYGRHTKITHWRYLPEPPKTEKP